MFKLPKEPMQEAEIQPTWEYLVKQERSLRRNLCLCRIIQPLGALICAWNLLLVGMNFLMFVAGDKIGAYFNKLPILPSLIDSMPRSGSGKVIFFSILLSYIIPLAICGLIAGVFYTLDKKKTQNEQLEPLNGTLEQRAAALMNKAENVYELRKKMPQWSAYLETGILTLVTALPLALMFIDYASEGAMVLKLVLAALALLVCLFVMFWVYAFVMYTFSLLNSLLYISEGKWKLYELYHRVRDYRESLHATEYSEN